MRGKSQCSWRASCDAATLGAWCSRCARIQQWETDGQGASGLLSTHQCRGVRCRAGLHNSNKWPERSERACNLKATEVDGTTHKNVITRTGIVASSIFMRTITPVFFHPLPCLCLKVVQTDLRVSRTLNATSGYTAQAIAFTKQRPIQFSWLAFTIRSFSCRRTQMDERMSNGNTQSFVPQRSWQRGTVVEYCE